MARKDMTVEEYRRALVTFAARRGLLFNPDDDTVVPLLEGLLANRARYGYPSCPCRLACGEQQADADLICPCAYAEADIKEFGKCYCELYVSQDYLDGKIDRTQRVPERRPPEKLCV